MCNVDTKDPTCHNHPQILLYCRVENKILTEYMRYNMGRQRVYTQYSSQCVWFEFHRWNLDYLKNNETYLLETKQYFCLINNSFSSLNIL